MPLDVTRHNLYGVIGFDFETTSRGPNKSPAPHYEENKVLCLAYAGQIYDHVGGKIVPVVSSYNDEHNVLFYVNQLVEYIRQASTSQPIVLVGANVSFDFQWLCRVSEYGDNLKQKLAIGSIILHDIQDLAYIGTGMLKKDSSLKELCEHFGLAEGEAKTDYLKSLLDAGLTAEDADPVKLYDYCAQDVVATNAAYQKGWDAPKDRHAYYWRALSNKGVMVLAETEGLPFDPDSAFTDAHDLVTEHSKVSNAADELVDTMLKESCLWFAVERHIITTESGVNVDVGEQFESALTSDTLDPVYDAAIDIVRDKLRTPQGIKALLQASEILYTKDSPLIVKVKYAHEIGRYKNGKIKYKTIEHKIHWSCPGFIHPNFLKNNEISGDADFIEKLLEDMTHDTKPMTAYDKAWHTYLTKTLKVRELEKQLGTYYNPLIRQASDSRDGRVHHRINTARTSTGRTSSSNPNAQNMPGTDKSTLKNHFTEEGWRYVEGDFKQVEVIALAARSKCPALIAALVGGVDMHFKSGSVVYGWKDPSEMTKDKKRIVKGVNFGLIYGGSYRGLSKQTGVDLATVTSIGDAFYSTFPGVRKFQDTIVKEADAKKQNTHKYICAETGQHRCGYIYKCPISGRKYTFLSYAGNVWKNGKKTIGQRMSPTELKNYTVQGLATADFVPFAVRYCVKHLSTHYIYGKDFKFVNTVHDSIQFQIKDTVPATEFCSWLSKFMTHAWHQFLKDCEIATTGHEYSFLWSLPMKGEIDCGKSWGEMITM